ncbi:Aliphatic sulfonates import ATP-binding protein SsuB [Planktothrix tepida]|uniref:ABC transporter, ATP-binding protein Putative aliphatic sulfonates transporter n=1 Tax=Planktothrix tepida PCC 9214 TaxID=671072 RepID=A0A1J1LIF6_9CYAN|nr:ATP-binding cassette domain-containing protein [Planktothrix tepida]CAD5927366.1 Aliphatic sulfonates import ATP-binding protein SsuB [Planktothrix tepida]CUR31353.1 Putative ABC transporter, ATP-binding protein; Putative aliphatic sulfonates transporter [Planktothrix tepida PCC 9214]
MNTKIRGSDVKLLGLSKSFGQTSILSHLSLDIKPGEFVAIVGRSGCGKSTLLRLIAGLDHPTAGGILVDGEPLHQLNPTARVMFQDSRLLLWRRVLENVGLGLRGDWKPKALEMLTQVGLGERAQDWIAVLSGGQRQRVALARALVSQPRLLLLDEPLGALDALTRIEMQSLIEQLWLEKQFTTLLITHDVEEAVVLADRVLLLEAGQITMDLDIPISRPRHRGDPTVARLVERILARVLKSHSSVQNPFQLAGLGSPRYQ